MHGPVWNNSKTGVTGEPKAGIVGEPGFRINEPNYVCVTDAEGKTTTLTGAAADAFRAARGH